MNIIKFSPEFGQWLAALRDIRGKVKILARLERAEEGNIVYLLLTGGDKSSQKRDIALARAMMEDD